MTFSSSDCNFFSTFCLKNCQRTGEGEEGGTGGGERSCPCLYNLMSKDHRSWRLVGRRRFHQTHAKPSALHSNKGVICLFLALQQREGWRKAWDRMEEYSTGMLCLAAKGAYVEKAALAMPCCRGHTSSGPIPHVSSSSAVLPACLLLLFGPYSYIYSSLQSVPSIPVSLQVNAGGCHLFISFLPVPVLFVILSVFTGSVILCFFFPSHYFENV